MKVKLLDVDTGKTVFVDEGINTFQWAENNWSCDCNRWMYFGEGEPIGCEAKRFLVVEYELEEGDYECSLRELNSDYPLELLAKHLT